MGILDRAVKASEIKENEYYINLLLLGSSGSGKTTSLLTLPGRGLVIDTDNRSMSLVGAKNIEILTITEEKLDNPAPRMAFKQLKDLKEELWTLVRKSKREGGEPFPFDWICLDGLTSTTKLAMNWVLRLTNDKGKRMNTSYGGGPAEPHYGPAIYNLDRLISGLTPLPCHVIVTGHEQLYLADGDTIKKDSTGETIYLPVTVGKSLRSTISTEFNETWLALREKRGKDIRYTWQTTGVGRMSNYKSSLNRRGKLWKDPVVIDLDEKPAGFAKLLALRFQQKGGEKDNA